MKHTTEIMCTAIRKFSVNRLANSIHKRLGKQAASWFTFEKLWKIKGSKM
jgi:hypothetical protein